MNTHSKTDSKVDLGDSNVYPDKYGRILSSSGGAVIMSPPSERAERQIDPLLIEMEFSEKNVDLCE